MNTQRCPSATSGFRPFSSFWTTRAPRLALALGTAAAVSTACSGEDTEWGEHLAGAEEADTVESAISGGNLVQGRMATENYVAATVRFLGCSGLKIGPRRILLAAHCVDGVQDGGTTLLTNRLDGKYDGTGGYRGVGFGGIYRHPSWAISKDPARAYDVAIVTLLQDTPDIPVFDGDILSDYVDAEGVDHVRITPQLPSC